jgi:hypothetical protein
MLLRRRAVIDDECFLLVQGLSGAFGLRPTTHRVLIYYQLVGIVLALSPLGLPGYVLLWITDWLPYLLPAPELAKITLITNVIVSIRRVVERKKKNQ